MSVQRVLSVLLMFAWLAACGSANEPPKPPPVEETVFRDTVAPLEKARDVQNIVDEQKRATDRAVEQNESDQ